jgi:antitoxin component YwqK of YwqJK toxin-antitoxin module
MTPSPASPLAASSPRWVVVLLSCAILVLAIGLLMYLVRPKHAAPALAEVSRTDLVLRDGLLYRAGEQSPFTGIATDTYAGGEPKSRSQISNGVPESVSVGYHTNGQIQVEEYFRAGVSHGRRTKWYASGTKQSEASIVAGKLHGLYQRWHENEVLSEQVELVEGEPEGVSLAYYPSGHLKARVLMQQGKPVEQQFWEDGQYEQEIASVQQAPPP